jgi:formylglycine-generating enzyme required for sulfatase activity
LGWTISSNGEILLGEFMSEILKNLEMVEIPAGSFMMGSPEDEEGGYGDERPQHEVSVPDFMIGKYPITQAQWRLVATLPKVKTYLEPNPSNFKGDKRPVESVSWLDAIEFCRRLSKLTKREYRLPSEAEWEYACRAGTTTAYSFGDKAAELGEYAWYGENSDSQTHPVGQKQPNAFGLYDMHGNVWEWCADDWHKSYKGAPKDSQIWIKDNKNYEDPESRKLLRGGSWVNDAWFCRSAFRLSFDARLQDDDVGFRVVCVVR